MKFLKENAWLRKAGMFLLDMVFVFISIYVSMELRFEMYIPVQHLQTLRSALPILVGCYMVCYALGGIYQVMWRYAGVRDVARLTLLSGIACGLTLAANQFFGLELFRGVLLMVPLIATIAIGGSRMLWRVFSKDRIPGGLGDAMPVMIVGAGEAGAYAVNICNKNPKQLGKPVLLLRRETERPEAVEAGTVKLTGVRRDDIIRDAQMLLNDPAAYERMATAASPYGDGHAAEHIADAIIEHFKNA